MDLPTRARRVLAPIKLRMARRFLRVDIRALGVRLFAQVNWVLHITRYASERGLTPIVRLQSENYMSRPSEDDWFSDFFVRLTNSPSVRNGIVICDFSELRLSFPRDLTLPEAHSLFFSHYAFSPEIAREAAALQVTVGAADQALGVHFRGTDKIEEAARVSYDDVARAIERHLSHNTGIRTIFVATDEAAFVDFITSAFPLLRFVYLTGATRSRDGQPVHLSTAPEVRLALGRDAIIDAIVLSQCSAVIRTSSFLSAWSCIFNPDLRTTTLNKPYAAKTWFPERVIMASSGSQPTRA